MPGRPFSRRTALGAALAAPLALAACDIDPPVRQTESSAAIPPPPEDSELVAGVLGSLFIAQSVLDAATRSVPALVDRLGPVRAAHSDHIEVLVGVADGVPTDPPCAGQGPALRAAPPARRAGGLSRGGQR